MDIGLLNEFIVLSKCLNYSKASDQLYISQSVLSRHIQNLENQLGVELFIRNKHSVALTPIGKIFAQDVSHVITEYNHALEHIQMSTKGTLGSLNIKTSSVLSSLFIYDFLPDFQKKYPNIKVNLKIEEVNESTKKEIEKEEIDLALLLDWTENKSNLSYMSFFKNYFYVFVPEGHVLYDRQSVDIEDLSNLPMVYLDQEENRPSLSYFEKLFTKHHAIYNPCIPASGTEEIFLNILNSGSVSILSEPVFRYAPSKVHPIPINDSEACLNTNLIWKKTTNNNCVHLFVKEFSLFAKIYNKNKKLPH